MMRRARVAIMLVVAGMAAAGEPLEAEVLARGCNAFACELHRALAAPGKNLLVSPYSVAVAMAMVREGARGETAREMDAVLRLPEEGGAAAAHAALAAALTPTLIPEYQRESRERTLTPAYELRTANALWAQEGMGLREPFLATLRDGFRAPLERIDFADSDGARRTINAWAGKQTNERIKDLVPPPLPTPATRLALANAIYFKAAWEKPFRPRLTKPGAFFTAAGEVEVPMMELHERLQYAETGKAQILELPYRGGETSMVIVLPRERAGLAEVEAELSADRVAAWLAGLSRWQIDAKVPKFAFTCPTDLTRTLAALGMARAFDPERADLSGMTTEEPLHVGVVLHKAFIAVDEVGTEAAAATFVGVKGGGEPQPLPRAEFVADHPFLFLIRHKATGCILFAGRLADPGGE